MIPDSWICVGASSICEWIPPGEVHKPLTSGNLKHRPSDLHHRSSDCSAMQCQLQSCASTLQELALKLPCQLHLVADMNYESLWCAWTTTIRTQPLLPLRHAWHRPWACACLAAASKLWACVTMTGHSAVSCNIAGQPWTQFCSLPADYHGQAEAAMFTQSQSTTYLAWLGYFTRVW